MNFLKFHNKKADMSGYKMMSYAIFSVVATFVALIVIYFNSSGNAQVADIPSGVENYLISQRFLVSSTCFSFQDSDSKRAYPWLIDIEKFSQENLDKCYSSASDTKVKAYRLTLIYGNEQKIISTRNWEGFLKSGQTKQIFLYNNGKVQTAELFIEMQDVK